MPKRMGPEPDFLRDQLVTNIINCITAHDTRVIEVISQPGDPRTPDLPYPRVIRLGIGGTAQHQDEVEITVSVYPAWDTPDD